MIQLDFVVLKPRPHVITLSQPPSARGPFLASVYESTGVGGQRFTHSPERGLETELDLEEKGASRFCCSSHLRRTVSKNSCVKGTWASALTSQGECCLLPDDEPLVTTPFDCLKKKMNSVEIPSAQGS